MTTYMNSETSRVMDPKLVEIKILQYIFLVAAPLASRCSVYEMAGMNLKYPLTIPRLRIKYVTS